MEQDRRDPLGRFIGRPFMPWNTYPWRPMDNRERLCAWSVKYFSQFDPLRFATDTRPVRVTSPERKPSVVPVGGGAAGTPEAML